MSGERSHIQLHTYTSRAGHPTKMDHASITHLEGSMYGHAACGLYPSLSVSLLSRGPVQVRDNPLAIVLGSHRPWVQSTPGEAHGNSPKLLSDAADRFPQQLLAHLREQRVPRKD